MNVADGKMPKLTVTELTSLIKTTLEGSFYGLTVEGELSGFRPAGTGHWYFSLKDGGALIGCAMWRSSIPRVGFVPKDGMRVVVTGNISVFEPRGTYQIICSSMSISGEGDILAMLEERKRRYAALGYFDASAKRPIPPNPAKVAVITSPTGAALQDILQITGRRNKGMDIIILPAVVQGAEAAQTVAKRIDEVNEYLLADVMIVGRGGGSIEDLLPFSEECVIEAIHRSRVPVISAVGHEIDWALSDYVADLRAPTPSAAAELVCQNMEDQLERLLELKGLMHDQIYAKLNSIRLRLAAFSPASARAQLDNRVARVRMALDGVSLGIQHRMGEKAGAARARIQLLVGRMEALSPINVMRRGYSIVTDRDGRTINEVKGIGLGDELTITVTDGNVKTRVQEVSDGR